MKLEEVFFCWDNRNLNFVFIYLGLVGDGNFRIACEMCLSEFRIIYYSFFLLKCVFLIFYFKRNFFYRVVSLDFGVKK